MPSTEPLAAEIAALQTRIAQLEAQQAARDKVCAALRGSESCALCVCDIMTPDPQVAHMGDSLRVLLERFRAGHFRRLPVLDELDRLVGIVTDRDLRQAANSPYILHERWQDDLLLDQITVDVVMTPEPITVQPDTPLYEAARIMRTRKIGGLPVLDADGTLVGIISEIDLLRAFEVALASAGEGAG